MVNKLDDVYKDLLRGLVKYGVDKMDRTGTGTRSIGPCSFVHYMKDGFPILTTRRIAFKVMATELGLHKGCYF